MSRLSEIPLGIPVITRWARATGPTLPSTHRAVLVDLSFYANAEGWAWPAQETVADNTGLARGTVNAAFRDLGGPRPVHIGLQGRHRGVPQEIPVGRDRLRVGTPGPGRDDRTHNGPYPLGRPHPSTGYPACRARGPDRRAPGWEPNRLSVCVTGR